MSLVIHPKSCGFYKRRKKVVLLKTKKGNLNLKDIVYELIDLKSGQRVKGTAAALSALIGIKKKYD